MKNRESMIETPLGRIKLSEYKQHCMESVRDEEQVCDTETLIRHFNKYGEQISETRTGKFPALDFKINYFYEALIESIISNTKFSTQIGIIKL